MPQYRRHREEGFTLVELLVVIIIIGILAAIAVPVFLNQRKKAHDAGLRQDIRSLAIAYDTWRSERPGERYPDVWHMWAGQTSTTDPNFTYRVATGTQFHAFDMNRYYPGKGYKAGEAYCIESVTKVGSSQHVYYHSAQGGILSGRCSDAPAAGA